MKDLQPSLLEGFLLCIWHPEAVRDQTSQWKRNLLVFLSGVCVEVSAVPYLAAWMGYETPALTWIVTSFFLCLGLVGLYASKFGNDRFVEWLLLSPFSS